MLREEIKELEEMFAHGRFHLEEDLAECPEETEEIQELLGAFKRIETALKDEKNHRLIVDLFYAVTFLDSAPYDCDEGEECEAEVEE